MLKKNKKRLFLPTELQENLIQQKLGLIKTERPRKSRKSERDEEDEQDEEEEK